MKIQTASLLMISSLLTSLFGCTKSSTQDEQVFCPAVVLPVYVNFNVIDANMGNDLFFSADHPQRPTSQLCFFKTKDKLFKDTIRPQVIGTGTARHFMVQINGAKAKDTLIMKFDSPEKLPIDVLSLETKMSKERCPQLVLDKAFWNNTEVVKTGDKLTLPKILIFTAH